MSQINAEKHWKAPKKSYFVKVWKLKQNSLTSFVEVEELKQNSLTYFVGKKKTVKLNSLPGSVEVETVWDNSFTCGRNGPGWK